MIIGEGAQYESFSDYVIGLRDENKNLNLKI